MSLPLPFRKHLPVGPFVREALIKIGPMSGKELYKLYRQEAKRLGLEHAKYKSFIRTIFYLKYLGLIEVVGKRPIPGRGVQETLYQITPKGMRTPPKEWSNPGKQYYIDKGITWTDPYTGQTIPLISLGTGRYKRMKEKRPPRPRGRPRKRWTSR